MPTLHWILLRINRIVDRVIRWLKIVHLRYFYSRTFFVREIRDWKDTPLKIKLRMWRGGFLSTSYHTYSLDRNDPEE